jgi:hypothetical protein
MMERLIDAMCDGFDLYELVEKRSPMVSSQRVERESTGLEGGAMIPLNEDQSVAGASYRVRDFDVVSGSACTYSVMVSQGQVIEGVAVSVVEIRLPEGRGAFLPASMSWRRETSLLKPLLPSRRGVLAPIF